MSGCALAFRKWLTPAGPRHRPLDAATCVSDGPIFAIAPPKPLADPARVVPAPPIALDTALGKIVPGLRRCASGSFHRSNTRNGCRCEFRRGHAPCSLFLVPCSLFSVPSSLFLDAGPPTLDALTAPSSTRTPPAVPARCAPARGKRTAAPFRRSQRGGCRRLECRERSSRRPRPPASCCASECG